MNATSSLFRTIGPKSGPYLALTSGPFQYQFWVKEKACRVQLRIESGDGQENDELFVALSADKDQIEEKLDAALVWDNNEGNRSNRIYWEVPGGAGYKTQGPERAAGIHALSTAMVQFHSVFADIIDKLDE